MKRTQYESVQQLTQFRSQAFYEAILEDPAKFQSLDPRAKLSFGLALKDRFFSLSELPRNLESVSFRGLIDLLEVSTELELEGLAYSFHPSSRFKDLRFLAADNIPVPWRPFFSKPSKALPDLAAVFVDREEFSFRNFENIIPLDKLFEGFELEMSLTGRIQPDEYVDAFEFRVNACSRSKGLLLALDSMNLYLNPLNDHSRGGRRFIFHSSRLSDCLSQAVRAAMPKDLIEGFSHVNPVFRCNRFDPEDEPFHSHYDTPYYDASRNHVSRYTLLIYLTEGSGPSLLEVSDVEWSALTSMTGIIFDQLYEHRGRPFDNGRKVFLRTELIFEQEVAHDKDIASLFSKACYMTGQSIFNEELAAYTHDCYDRVAAAHWNGLAEGADHEPFIHKNFRHAHFLTNGFDFWFPKEKLSLIECAALTLLDYFNCKIDGLAFRKICHSESLEGHRDARWIPDFLDPFRTLQPESLFCKADTDKLFSPAESKGPRTCCPGHNSPENFDPFRSEDILKIYEGAQRFCKTRMKPAAILILGQDLLLDESKFVISSDKIYVALDDNLTPINFASCWNCTLVPPLFVDVDVSIEALHFHLPPIQFTEHENCYHLSFDFFRNSWMVKHRQMTLPLPKIIPLANIEDHSSDHYPWLEAVDKSLVKPSSPRTTRYPFWGNTPLSRELYGY